MFIHLLILGISKVVVLLWFSVSPDTCTDYFSSVSVSEWPTVGKKSAYSLDCMLSFVMYLCRVLTLRAGLGFPVRDHCLLVS